VRLFVGIDVDGAVRDCAARAVAALQRAGVDGRLEPREKLHVTVAFLGAVDDARLAEVIAALDTVRVAPFTFPLERIGAFPSLRRPTIVWLGPRRAQPAFRECVSAVRSAFVPLGVRFQRPPDGRPHLTLARLRRDAGPLHVSFGPARAIDVTADALTLFQSLPDGKTTRYEVLHRHVL